MPPVTKIILDDAERIYPQIVISKFSNEEDGILKSLGENLDWNRFCNDSKFAFLSVNCLIKPQQWLKVAYCVLIASPAVEHRRAVVS